jgi:hypothetical protein
MSVAREDEFMASRPLAFGIRYREKGRTVRVRASERDPRRYVVEVGTGRGRKRRREHSSLGGALRDFAASWRARLH